VWLTDEQQAVWRNYLAIGSQLPAAMNRQLQRDCGLSLSDYGVLVELSERGPLRVFELADVLVWEQSRLSHQLRRMRTRGLLVRRRSGDDRRGAVIDLTDQGRAALRAAAPGHVELIRSTLFEDVRATQLRAVRSWTETVLTRLATSQPRRSE
jgi:DNA-binding MarR family transcriptional regulator